MNVMSRRSLPQSGALLAAALSGSRSFDPCPGQPHERGLSLNINAEPGPNGRSAGSVSWAGRLSCYVWLDPVRNVTGVLFTQVLALYEARVAALYGAFERELHAGLA